MWSEQACWIYLVYDGHGNWVRTMLLSYALSQVYFRCDNI
jgi:hypothetical protein